MTLFISIMSTSVDYSNSRETTPDATILHKHKRHSSLDLQLLKNAHSSSSSVNKIAQKNSLEEDLLLATKNFIHSIEGKLDHLENLFKSNNEFKGKSENLYDTLISIKNSVFNKAASLEHFNSILDEHYGDLLSSINSYESLDFHEKLLTGLNFLDAKINHLNSLVENETKNLLGENYFPLNTHRYDSIKSFEIKFHNYEKAALQGSTRLLNYFELPFPWRENQYIIHGYRFHNSPFHALKSVCTCHNETTNIWTHLMGAFLMIYISLVDFPNSELFQKSNFMDNLVIYLFLISSIKCLLSSSVWHTFNGTSILYMRQKYICMDYTGITVLITASIVTTEYAALFYYPFLRGCFIAFSLLCGVGGLFFNWTPFFDKPESKPFRIAFYISLSALGISAFFFLGCQKGFAHALKFYLPMVRSFIWYLIGVVFYGSLVPERFRSDVLINEEPPEEDDLVTEKVAGNLDVYFRETVPLTDEANSITSLWWIDYIFSSHNIWHFFVLFGVLGHYSAIYEMFMNIPTNK